MYGGLRVGEVARMLAASVIDDRARAAGAHARSPLVFFDLETTGLSGGAGTCAFLVGCAAFEEDGTFVTRQFLLPDQTGEREMLRAVAGELGRVGLLVSFNGKSFDVPMLETRYLYQRMTGATADLAHLDVLHLARLFWGSRPILPHRRGAAAMAPRSHHSTGRIDVESASCSLGTLERQILGVSRADDVPGHQIPARYFHFVRSGTAEPLLGVFEHNRHDLLSLACLTARLLHLVAAGPLATADAREAFALGRLYSRAHDVARARDAFERALVLSAPLWGRAAGQDGDAEAVRVAALRELAHVERRARRHHAAAERWREVVNASASPTHVVHEATEALAIHQEHRVKDLEAARRLVLSLESLSSTDLPRWEAAQFRLARLDRKLAARLAAAEALSLPLPL